MAAACGGSSRPAAPTAPSPPPPAPLNLTGVYSGPGNEIFGVGGMRWVLSQSGSSVDGTVTATNAQGVTAARGTLEGTLKGTALSFIIEMPRGGLPALPACSATIEGLADATASTIEGIFSGTASCSTSFAGQFALTRE